MKKHLFVASLVAACAGYADVTVPGIFSDNAVLQTSPSTAVFGKADPGEKVSVTYGSAKAETVAGKDGKWLVRLDLAKDDGAGKDLVISGKNKITCKNVITGEVWFCIGQSNMAMTVGRSLDAKENVAKSANDRIRQFRPSTVSPEKPVDTIRGRWVIASPESTGNFTAAGYFFARKINAETGKAFGLVNPSWGGSSIESWISYDKIMKGSTPAVAKRAKMELDAYFSYDARCDRYVKALSAWAEANKQISDGKSVTPPADAKWSKARKLTASHKGSGVVWFKKEINITKKDYHNRKLRLEFGRPAVPVKVFFDGKLVKSLDLKTAVTGRQLTAWVPAKIATPGKHVITLRVDAITPKFSFPRYHYIGRRGETFDNWLTCRECDFAKLDRKTVAAMPKYPGAKPFGSKSPTMIWNGLVHPILSYTMKGALWYQGEQNAGSQRFLYGDHVRALVSDLRERFGNPDMRFYAAQLPNFHAKNPDPNSTGNWVDVRAGQSSAMNIPGVAQAIIIDLGESRDIHPLDKVPVGERLAAIALRNDYGKSDLAAYSPEAVSAKKDGSAVRVTFKYADGGLVTHKLPDYYWVIRSKNMKNKLVRNSPDSEVEGFAICGKNGKWVWANARISGNEVIVSAPAVKEPVSVRYAWQNNPTCNLYNGAGFPAAPFQMNVK